jgi:ABC-type transporter Mla subunit MlaD
LKLVTNSLNTITEGSAKVDQALGEAATEIAAQVGGLPGKVADLLAEMAEDFQAIAVKLSEIPDLLNPQPLVAPLPGQLTQTMEQIKSICSEAAGIPATLAQQVSDVHPISEAVTIAIRALAELPEQLLGLLPSVPEKLKPLTDLSGLAETAIQRSQGCQSRATEFMTEVTPLTAELKSIALTLQKLEQNGVVSEHITSPLRDRETDLKDQISAQFDRLQGQLMALKDQLLQDVSQMRDLVSGVEADLMSVLIDAKAQVQSVVTQGLEPLLAGKGQVIAFQAKVQEEAQHCNDLFDQANEAMVKAVDDLKEVIESVRSSLEEVGGVLNQAGQDVQVLVDQSLEPMDLLQDTANACLDAIDHVVVVVGEQVDAVKLALDDIALEVENTKSSLQELPQQFDPVREFISTAADEVESIRSQVSDFVGQAMDALSIASGHLNQADGLCDTAIDVCTKHMAIAPPLAIAKSLYVGIKSSIPTLQASIQSAEAMVTKAGKTANDLMDQAQAVVLGLNPVLDLMLEKLQDAIDALVELLTQLQQGIVTAKSALDAIFEKLEAAVDEMRQQMNGLLDVVKDHAQQFVSHIKIQETVDGLVQKLHDFSQPILESASEKLDESTGSVSGFVKNAKAQISDSVDSFDAQIQKMIDLIDAAYQAGQSAGESLNQPLEALQNSWEDLEAQALAQVDTTSSYLEELVNQTLSDVAEKIGVEWAAT